MKKRGAGCLGYKINPIYTGYLLGISPFKGLLGGLNYIGDEILPSYVGIMSETSISGSHH